jgi:hypothetical protein
VLTTNQKGAIAEAAVVLEAAKLGIRVSRPLADCPYDSVFDVNGLLLRVQCKWAACHGDVLSIRCYSGGRGRGGFVRRYYSPAQVDAYAAYSGETDRCYFLPLSVFGAQKTIQLRLAPSRNNQTQRVHWAKAFEFAATLGSPGAIAQLGEHLRGTQGVAGSSPASSTLEGVARTAAGIL